MGSSKPIATSTLGNGNSSVVEECCLALCFPSLAEFLTNPRNGTSRVGDLIQAYVTLSRALDCFCFFALAVSLGTPFSLAGLRE